MTKQLESLGHKLTVDLIYDGFLAEDFCRNSILKLDQQPVVAASSIALKNNPFFIELLQKANSIPIGKFLFAENSMVLRDKITTKFINNISHLPQSLVIFLRNNYTQKQSFWQRTSRFIYQEQEMHLIEIILPGLDLFFD